MDYLELEMNMPLMDNGTPVISKRRWFPHGHYIASYNG